MNQTTILEKVAPLVHECAIVPTQEIVFRSAVREACKRNYCGMYGASWSCPPAIEDLPVLEQKCKSFSFALLFSTFGLLEDSFDFEGMMRQRDVHDAIQKKVVQAVPLSHSFLLGAGACRLCKSCSYPAPCRHPKERISSIESHGIDVVSLAKTAQMQYMNGENTVTYFSILFFN